MAISDETDQAMRDALAEHPRFRPPAPNPSPDPDVRRLRVLTSAIAHLETRDRQMASSVRRSHPKET